MRLGFGKNAMRGPYGTNEGDVWLGTDSDIGRMLMEEDGLTLIWEVMFKNGMLQECMYPTDNPELIARAEAGHKEWVAAQAANN